MELSCTRCPVSFVLPDELRSRMPVRPARIEEEWLEPALRAHTPLPQILANLRDAVLALSVTEQTAYVVALLRLRLRNTHSRDELSDEELSSLADAIQTLQYGRQLPPLDLRDAAWQQIALALEAHPRDASKLLSLLLWNTTHGKLRIAGGDDRLIPSNVIDFLRYWLRSAERMDVAQPATTTSGPSTPAPLLQTVMLHPVVVQKDSGSWAWAASLLGWQGFLTREMVWRRGGMFVVPGLDMRNAISWAILEMVRYVSKPTKLMVMLPLSSTAPEGQPTIPSGVASDLEWLPTHGHYEDTPPPEGLPIGRIRTQFAILRDQKGLVHSARVHIGIPSHENLHERKPPFEEDVLKQIAERAWAAWRAGKLEPTTAPELPGTLIE